MDNKDTLTPSFYQEAFWNGLKNKRYDEVLKVVKNIILPKNVFFYNEEGNSSYYIAALKGNETIIDCLIDGGYYDELISIHQNTRNTLAHILVQRGFFDLFKKAIERMPYLLEQKNGKRELPFFEMGDLKTEQFEKFLQFFLDKKIDITQKNAYDLNILHLIAKDSNKNDLFVKLLELGVDINQEDYMGYTPLDYAYDFGNLELVDKIIFEHERFVDIYRFLKSAIDFEDLDIVTAILKDQNLYDHPNPKMLAAIPEYIDVCIETGQMEMLEEFLLIGNPLQQKQIYSIAFERALMFENIKAMKIIHDSCKGNFLNDPDYHASLFAVTCANGSTKIFNLIVELFPFETLNRRQKVQNSEKEYVYPEELEGAPYSLVDYPPITLAVKANNLEMVKYILEHSDRETEQINMYNDLQNPLCYALESQNISIAHTLLEKGFFTRPKKFLELIQKYSNDEKKAALISSLVLINDDNLQKFFDKEHNKSDEVFETRKQSTKDKKYIQGTFKF